MTQTELAEALGIAQSQVSRYCARGMPRDEPGARAWISNHIRLTMKSPLYRRQVRARPTPDTVAAATQMLELAGQALDDDNLAGFDALVPACRAALSAVPEHARAAVLLRVDVIDRLCAPMLEMVREALAEDAAAGEPEPPMTDDDAAAMGRFWYGIAAGERVEVP